MSEQAMVLLSGGVDSTAALLWALDRGFHCHAVGVDYCQPAATAERAAAMNVAAKAGVPFSHFCIAEAVSCLGLYRPDFSTSQGADMPGRNAILLSCAAGYAARLGMQRAELVIGCNLDDAMWHVDCSQRFLMAMSDALHESSTAVEGILAPWAGATKRRVVMWLESEHHGYLELTLSCYLGTRCGTCAACVARARAIEGTP